MMNNNLTLAASLTKAASQQTFYTIRFLVDRDRVADAYRAYAYFRWVDDSLDAESASGTERTSFLERQKSLLTKYYRGERLHGLRPEEQLLLELVQRDTTRNSGLHVYLHNMMAVMSFDAQRRGRLISQSELHDYTRWLATAVTEAMHYFIGHSCYAPGDESRYRAVTAAHIIHMLRDTFDDVQAGYFNVPREFLDAHHISPFDVQSAAYRAWVRNRVRLARLYFQQGREYLHRLENPRCRLAGFAYTARFAWLLDTIEREDYCIRSQYEERRSSGVGLRMTLDTLTAFMSWRSADLTPQTVPVQKDY